MTLLQSFFVFAILVIIDIPSQVIAKDEKARVRRRRKIEAVEGNDLHKASSTSFVVQELNILQNAATTTTTTANRESRIIGGNVANRDEYRFHVRWPVGCGATLIYEDIVLTAAHCLFGIWNENVWVGAHYMNNDGIPNKIEASNPHPDYDFYENSNDFMVMKLKDSVPSSVITPVTLNSDEENPTLGDQLTVIGFGDVETGSGNGSNRLRKVTLPYVPHHVCEQAYGDGEIIDSVMFCAGSAGKDSCQGDSGGPLLDKDGQQVGVVSWGNGCGLEEFPGIYSRVSSAYDWMQEQICILSSNPPSSCAVQSRKLVTIHFVYDDYPDETSWKLIKNDDKSSEDPVVIAELLRGTHVYPGLNTRKYNLLPGYYTFEARDTVGDGVCCEYGNGGFTITDGSKEIQHNGLFTDDVSVNFIITENGELLDASDSAAQIILQQQQQQQLSSPLQQQGLQTYSSENSNNSNRKHVVIQVVHDEFPSETSWMFINQGTGEQVYLQQYGSIQTPGAIVIVDLYVDSGNYWFLLLDSANDGICCNYGSGSVQIHQVHNSNTNNEEEEIIIQDDGTFMSKAEHFFSVQ